jgi:hypothetical protein
MMRSHCRQQYSTARVLGANNSAELRVGLIDTRQRFRDAHILQLALTEIFLNVSTRSRNCGIGLINLRPIVIVLQLDEEVALVYSACVVLGLPWRRA